MAKVGTVNVEVVVRLVLGGEPDRSKSPCHGAKVWMSLGDGVLQGSCAECGQNVVRLSPDGEEEWLVVPLVAGRE